MGERSSGQPETQREFGRRVRALRKALGYTQETLAELACMHRTYVGELERGCKNPTLLSILRLAKGVGTDPGTLIQGMELGD